jgi:hypothetical protein
MELTGQSQDVEENSTDFTDLIWQGEASRNQPLPCPWLREKNATPISQPSDAFSSDRAIRQHCNRQMRGQPGYIL